LGGSRFGRTLGWMRRLPWLSLGVLALLALSTPFAIEPIRDALDRIRAGGCELTSVRRLT